MSHLTGHLEAYWEQGWEGRIEFFFVPDDGQRPLPIQAGDHLTIFNEDGTVLWSGQIEWVRKNWWQRHQLDNDVWSWHKQKGVKYADWIGWFWHKPPLPAHYEIRS